MLKSKFDDCLKKVNFEKMIQHQYSLKQFQQKLKSELRQPQKRKQKLSKLFSNLMSNLFTNLQGKEAVSLTTRIRNSIKTKNNVPPTNSGYYKRIKVLGKGQFGEVWLSQQLLTNRLVAIKIIKKDPENYMNKFRIEQERMMLSVLRFCKNVNHLIEYFESEGSFYFVMEYVSEGCLLDKIERESPLPEAKVRKIFLQICHGLKKIHSENILHRDIKLENVLIDKN